MPAADDGERRLGRPQHLDLLRPGSTVRDIAGDELRRLLVARGHHQRHEPPVRRQQPFAAIGDLGL